MAETKEVTKKEAEGPESVERTRDRRVYIPSVDILERKDDIILYADMPGVGQSSIDITLEKNELALHGTVDVEIPEKHRLVFSEYGVGDYHRVFTLSDEVDKEKIQATVKDGVLKLVLPKRIAARTQKITVQAG